MNPEFTGALIRRRRLSLGLTQAQLAQQLHVSDKAVSKWERGAGNPDAALIPALSRLLGVSAESLLSGDVPEKHTDGGNMKRIKIYHCPLCGNLLTATSAASLSCCGRLLEPLSLRPADDAHAIAIEPIEDEWLLTWTHPMEKQHHLSFLLEVGFDTVALTRLYAEGGCEKRMPRLPGGKFFCGCTNEPGALFELKK